MAGEPDSGRPILVTGATGFLGSEIVRCARSAGLRVRPTSRGAGAPESGIISADILKPSDLRRVVPGASAVIHAAGLAHQFGTSKPEFNLINRSGAANVARAAVAADVELFILVSSVSVYGVHSKLTRETVPCQPEGAYALSKLQAEQEVSEIVAGSKVRLIVLRMATIYGEGDPGNIFRLIRAIHRNRFVMIGKGSNIKSLINKVDAAKACLAALAGPAADSRIFNVSASPCTIGEIIQILHATLDKRFPAWSIPDWAARSVSAVISGVVRPRGTLGSVHETVLKWLADDGYDGSEFERTFDFRAEITLQEGLRREVAWYLAQAS